MAMKPGADLDSLPILDNQDNFVAHAYAAFILEFSYVALNNLSQLNSFKSYSSRLFFKATPVHLSYARFFGFTIYLVSQIANLPGDELSYALVCSHQRSLHLLSVIFCLFQMGS